MEWLRKVTDERKFESLAGLCFGVQPRDFARPAGSTKSRELDLIDIEQTQMEDLSAMRGRPHLLPYRRYLYIGEVSLDPKTKSKYETEVSGVISSVSSPPKCSSSSCPPGHVAWTLPFLYMIHDGVLPAS